MVPCDGRVSSHITLCLCDWRRVLNTFVIQEKTTSVPETVAAEFFVGGVNDDPLSTVNNSPVSGRTRAASDTG